ncbi:lysine N(6)-hydroxylase/L-ornithine N(5)-oxygenase family protein [Actinokineospora bangkokensis]|uniref:L-lysine N6-monooxygenase MbtG n=1 Tax=Actinokineospora bangkokensis TaxID=1193682 RepID=A0A1Q9LJL7_9PSEU|nr:SidA/IucD/PvdA family monooxygenase [Actinokineospora bangkokensis]OLR92242.1 L-lysine 6-monooxygenase [Actinokineospora bangkokensis]
MTTHPMSSPHPGTPDPTAPPTGEVLDVVGIGIGPSNLSLAALLAGAERTAGPGAPGGDGVRAVFLDRAERFTWHAGLMLPDVQMQVHYLKDLVTPVDPTSPYSFPAFLVENKRFYRLLVTGRSKVPRREFEQYCQWAAERVPNLRFGVDVRAVDWDGELFTVETGEGTYRARNVVTGTGLDPKLPACATGFEPHRVFHASQVLAQPRDFTGLRVAVVGGGQSGAEVVHHLLSTPDRPAAVLWGTSRDNLLPLDDTPFVDELFVPNYSTYFHGLPAARRAALVERQRMASDGVSASLLEAIYQRLYDLEELDGLDRPCRVLLGHRLTSVTDAAGALRTGWLAGDGSGLTEDVDVVICATGYRHDLPAPLHRLRELLVPGGELAVRADFSLEWRGPEQNRVYVQNAARHRFGVADPNLSLLAWRSATIANSLLGFERYDTGAVRAALDWVGHPAADADPDHDVPMAVLGHR